MCIQLRSANKFLNMDSFKEWVFVTPEEHVALLVHFLEQEVVRLPCLQPKKVSSIDRMTTFSCSGGRMPALSSAYLV